MNRLKECLSYGMVSLAVAGYLYSQYRQINPDLSQIIPDNGQRIQKQSGDSCYTQIGATEYYLETVRINAAEEISKACQRGDRSAKVIRKYALRDELPAMNRDLQDDFGELKIISTADFLNYFLPKGK